MYVYCVFVYVSICVVICVPRSAAALYLYCYRAETTLCVFVNRYVCVLCFCVCVDMCCYMRTEVRSCSVPLLLSSGNYHETRSVDLGSKVDFGFLGTRQCDICEIAKLRRCVMRKFPLCPPYTELDRFLSALSLPSFGYTSVSPHWLDPECATLRVDQ